MTNLKINVEKLLNFSVEQCIRTRLILCVVLDGEYEEKYSHKLAELIQVLKYDI